MGRIRVVAPGRFTAWVLRNLDATAQALQAQLDQYVDKHARQVETIDWYRERNVEQGNALAEQTRMTAQASQEIARLADENAKLHRLRGYVGSELEVLFDEAFFQNEEARRRRVRELIKELREAK